jgi:hypothetical protein
MERGSKLRTFANKISNQVIRIKQTRWITIAVPGRTIKEHSRGQDKDPKNTTKISFRFPGTMKRTYSELMTTANPKRLITTSAMP